MEERSIIYNYLIIKQLNLLTQDVFYPINQIIIKKCEVFPTKKYD